MQYTTDSVLVSLCSEYTSNATVAETVVSDRTVYLTRYTA